MAAAWRHRKGQRPLAERAYLPLGATHRFCCAASIAPASFFFPEIRHVTLFTVTASWRWGEFFYLSIPG